MKEVLKRELKAYFAGPWAYLFGAVILLICGIGCIRENLSYQIANFEYALQASLWSLFAACALLEIKLQSRIHAADQLPFDLPDGDIELPKEKGWGGFRLLKPTRQDIQDALYYRQKALEGSLSSRSLTLGRALSLVLMLAVPMLLLHLYPLIMRPYGEVYLASAYAALWAFAGVGLILIMLSLLLATSEKHPVIALAYTLLIMLTAYFLPQIALWASSAYAAMLFFTLVIVLIAMAVYLLSKNVLSCLLVGAVLEVIQVIFFLIRRDAFEGLAVRVMMELSPVVRFNNFIGGLLDVPALIYFLLFAGILLLIAAGQTRQMFEALRRGQDVFDAVKAAREAKAEKLSSGKLSRTRQPRFTAEKQAKELADAMEGMTHSTGEALTDEEKAALKGAADRAALKGLIAPVSAIALSAALLLALNFTGTALIKDVTSTGMFKESDQFRQVLDGVNRDVTCYWICQNGAEDASLQSALYYYSRQNRHFKVQKLEPLSNAPFLQTYIVESISNDALLLQCGGRTRYLPREELYGNDYSRYEETGTYDLAFQLENMLGHGLSYVCGQDSLPVLYEVTGHGETPLTDYWKVMIQKLDLEVASTTLDQIPANALGLVLANPTSDLSEEEAALLKDYLANGGKLLLVTNLSESGQGLPRLEEIMASYGIQTVPGIVIEKGSNTYSAEGPYSMYPRMLVHKINEEAAYSEKRVLLSEVQALTLKDAQGASTTPLLLSSEEAYSKLAGYQLDTYDEEEGDIHGPLTLGALSETSSGASVVWVASASLLDEDVNETAEGGNRYFIYGTLRYFGADDSWTFIPSIRYNYGLLLISDTLVSRLGLLFAGIFPVFYLLIGGIFWALGKRREMNAKARQEEEERKALEDKRRLEEEEAATLKEAARAAKREKARRAHEEALKRNQP